MSLAATLAEIEVHEVDELAIRAFQHEGMHYSEAFNLFKEAAAYVCILANTTVGSSPTWDVRQAVLGGHLVRMFKLMRFVLEESIENRAELLSILVRLVAECVLNLRYLIQNDNRELIDSFVTYSLQHERDLASRIRDNVRENDGQELPIERRMLNSIERTFLNSGVDEADLPKKRVQNWGGKNLHEKAKDVFLGEAYLAIFGGPSGNVHGGWHDLLQHHLKVVAPEQFKANLEFTTPRPQPIYALTGLIAETLSGYVELLAHSEVGPLFARLSDLHRRNLLASNLHEEYLVQRSGA
jgi:hypothetical protein